MLRRLLLRSAVNPAETGSFTNSELEQFYPENLLQDAEPQSAPIVPTGDIIADSNLDLESLSELVKELVSS